MDERLQQIERGGSAVERLRARRQAGWDEEEAWAGLVTPELPYAEALELAKQLEGLRFLGVTRQTCGELEGETGRFEHEATGLVFRLIPGGSYLMGSPKGVGRNMEWPQHEVTVEPFWLCETPCTQAAWDRIAREHGIEDERSEKGEEFAIEKVSWHDVRTWCEKAGLRLPSEAEWEYACRAGSAEAYCFGESEAELPDYAWFDRNSGRLHSVGKKKPNAWGLHDMHGNVWEWCEDDWGPHYEGAPAVGWPARQVAGASERVSRGGCWRYSVSYCRSAYRYRDEPDSRRFDLGFRPARSYQPAGNPIHLATPEQEPDQTPESRAS